MHSQKSSTTTPTADSSAIDSTYRYRRIVAKAGTSLLTRDGGRLNPEAMGALVRQIAQLHQRGAEVLLVTSGAVAAGREVLGVPQEGKDLPFRQVLAAVGQSRLMRTYEELFGRHDILVAQALLTWKDLSDRQSYLNVRNTLMALMELGAVPVLNENDVVAVDEIGEVFGDNDRLSAMVANLVDADLLVVLTEVDGLYTADPNQDPPVILMALDARVGLASAGGSREVVLDEFFTDYYETVVRPDELVTRVVVPRAAPHTGSTYLKFLPRTSEDYATVGVAARVSLEPDSGVCQDCRLVLGGVGATPLRAREAEDLLKGQKSTPELLEAVGAAARQLTDPVSDSRGSAQYKTAMIGVFVGRAIDQAWERALA